MNLNKKPRVVRNGENQDQSTTLGQGLKGVNKQESIEGELLGRSNS
jgi:hypothetical protein